MESPSHDFKLVLGKEGPGQGGLVLESTRTDINPEENYVSANCQDGNWIVFNNEHGYMYDYEYATLLSDSERFKYLPEKKRITAAFTVDVKEGGLCVFRGHNFYDRNMTFTEVEAAIADQFKPLTNDGVSSCIVFEPNSWEMTYIVDDASMTTATVTVPPGKYDDMTKVGINSDRLVSARKLPL
ncbi:uncharacterized protein LOC114532986 [Dendronephthya gigantea]|uniref:uncharacterized protein LOC114532986 n=1 Tax=Dendronephthya gigantea TaxID=151771 RepID=UPI00106A1487|nr:uncharacterized protein LOC114532986 [Dendronephthya gigantea]